LQELLAGLEPCLLGGDRMSCHALCLAPPRSVAELQAWRDSERVDKPSR
jgi:hypothetical protein